MEFSACRPLYSLVKDHNFKGLTNCKRLSRWIMGGAFLSIPVLLAVDSHQNYQLLLFKVVSMKCVPFFFKSITFCTLYCGTGMHTARGIFRFDHFLVPTVGRFVCCPNKAHVFNPEICPRYICCTRTQKEHQAEMLERWIFPSCRWAMFQVLWSVLPKSVGILTIVWWYCSRYPFPCFSQGCSLCICCTEEIFGNASKQEGTRS